MLVEKIAVVDIKQSLTTLLNVVKENGANKIHCNGKIASLLLELDIYKSFNVSYKHGLIEPTPLGVADGVDIWIDPNISWDNSTIFLYDGDEYIDGLRINDIHKLF